MTKLYGVLPTYKRSSDLATTLTRLSQQDRPLDYLLVIDNSPSTETRVIVGEHRRHGHRVEYVAAEENLGFAGGVALGMSRLLFHADPDDWIVVLDDDDPPGFNSLLKELEDFAYQMLFLDQKTAVVGLVGGRFDWRRGGLVRVPDSELNGPVPVDFIGGNHFPLYRAEVLRSLGVFSKEIFFGLSEVEHGLRLRAAGYSIYAHGTMWKGRRLHWGRFGLDSGRGWRLPEKNWRRYYSLRNLIYILRLHGKSATAARVTLLKGLGKPLLNIPLNAKLGLDHLRMNIRACKDGWTGNMGRTLEPDGSYRSKG